MTSTANVELMRSIGADHVIDYTREDFTMSADRHDFIVKMGGNAWVRACRRVLTPTGRLVLVGAGKRAGGRLTRVLGATVRSRLLKQPVIAFIAGGPFRENLLTLKELIEVGKVTPVIDRTYALSEIAGALRYVEEGRARGKVVVTVP